MLKFVLTIRHTHRQKEGQTIRRTDIPIERQTDRRTDTRRTNTTLQTLV